LSAKGIFSQHNKKAQKSEATISKWKGEIHRNMNYYDFGYGQALTPRALQIIKRTILLLKTK
jgi:hypothetical protein